MPAITNVTELQAMNADLAGTYWLANDIDASDTVNWNGGAGFIPVGNNTTKFTGNFDGAGFTISGLFINRPTTTFVGLFGRTITGVIKDVVLSGVNITGQAWVGGLVGVNDGVISGINVIGGSVTGGGLDAGGVSGGQYGAVSSVDCHSSATIVNTGTNRVGGLFGTINAGSVSASSASGSVTGNAQSGGLIGYLSSSGIVHDSYATGSVIGTTDVGGLVGESFGVINRCYASGNVNSTSSVSGGCLGRARSGCNIDDCYATGNVSGGAGTFIGGFIGYAPTGTTVDKCYSTGAATGGASRVGGFVGDIAGGTVTNCFWDTQTSGNATDGLNGTATGKTTAEMQAVATFTDETTVGLTNPWDFVNNPNDDAANNDYWGIHATFNGGYPYLTAIQTPPETPSTRRSRFRTGGSLNSRIKTGGQL